MNPRPRRSPGRNDTRWTVRWVIALLMILGLVWLPATATATAAPPTTTTPTATTPTATTPTATTPTATTPTTTTPTTTTPTTTTPTTTTPTPTISVSPATQTAQEGRIVNFRASPAGTRAISWQTAPTRGGPWTALTTGPVLTVLASRSADGHWYRAVAVEMAPGHRGTTTSEPATLHVTTPAPPPASTTSPSTTSPTPISPTPTPDAAQPYGTVVAPELLVGLAQTAIGHGFVPGNRVRVTLEPGGVDLGTQTVAPDGTITTSFSTAGLTVGGYTLRWTTL